MYNILAYVIVILESNYFKHKTKFIFSFVPITYCQFTIHIPTPKAHQFPNIFEERKIKENCYYLPNFRWIVMNVVHEHPQKIEDNQNPNLLLHLLVLIIHFFALHLPLTLSI